MDVVIYQGKNIRVQEVARPMWGTILYQAQESNDMFIVYLVSTGPYKMDIPNVYKLSVNEVAQFHAKKLNIEALCQRLLSHAT
ncbi:hypothetical protein HR060_15255 [Catenovulum sp. SM1970]|uniref:hypothetical protein n=1 Tax=Marinifaba aquimaris TaxID=2741323 RepID=UPI0015735FC2|nr:hypothetical protein [Marinifaba aquimaris]NTS78208.1 hypothetical protein [Marinifaba aquimaris]